MFKVGDYVKIVGSDYAEFNNLTKVGVIAYLYETTRKYFIIFSDGSDDVVAFSDIIQWNKPKEFETMKVYHLFEHYQNRENHGDVFIDESGEEYTYNHGMDHIEFEGEEITENLDSEDIMTIKIKPLEIKKMTLSEVEEELGYSIRIVEG